MRNRETAIRFFCALLLIALIFTALPRTLASAESANTDGNSSEAASAAAPQTESNARERQRTRVQSYIWAGVVMIAGLVTLLLEKRRGGVSAARRPGDDAPESPSATSSENRPCENAGRGEDRGEVP